MARICADTLETFPVAFFGAHKDRIDNYRSKVITMMRRGTLAFSAGLK